jgi:hypothetical protein
LFIYKQNFDLKELDPEKELDVLFDKEFFKQNQFELITIFQTLIMSKKFDLDIPLLSKLQQLAKDIWYDLDMEKQFYIFNLFNYHELESEILKEEFEELNTQLFLSNQ